MTEGKYGKHIVTEVRDMHMPAEQAWKATPGRGMADGRRRAMEHMVWMDSNVIDNAFYCEAVWLWPELDDTSRKRAGQLKSSVGVPAHSHPFPEILSYSGTDVEHPEELYCQVEFWMEGEKFLLDKSFACYIPAGVTHCPLRRHNTTRPLFHYAMSPDRNYLTSNTPGTRNEGQTDRTGRAGLGYARYFGDREALLTARPFHLRSDSGLVRRISHVDGSTVPDSAISCQSMWILPGFEYLPSPTHGGQGEWKEHQHNFGELIAFYGFNYNDIMDLGAEIEFWIDGQKYDIVESFTSYIPAGTRHGPLRIKNVKRPIMHFIAADAPTYTTP
jgi:mannose-6-phosphate isomerase-like protein (cupin superfamily)